MIGEQILVRIVKITRFGPSSLLLSNRPISPIVIGNRGVRGLDGRDDISDDFARIILSLSVVRTTAVYGSTSGCSSCPSMRDIRPQEHGFRFKGFRGMKSKLIVRARPTIQYIDVSRQ